MVVSTATLKRIGYGTSKRFLRGHLLREVHAAHQSLKAWFGAQWIQARIGVSKDHVLIVLFVSPLKPRDRLVFLAEAKVGLREEETGNIPVPGRFFQLIDQLLRLTLPSFEPIDTGYGGYGMAFSILQWVASLPPLPSSNGLWVHLLLSIRPHHAPVITQALEPLDRKVILARCISYVCHADPSRDAKRVQRHRVIHLRHSLVVSPQCLDKAPVLTMSVYIIGIEL